MDGRDFGPNETRRFEEREGISTADAGGIKRIFQQ